MEFQQDSKNPLFYSSENQTKHPLILKKNVYLQKNLRVATFIMFVKHTADIHYFYDE